MKKSISGCTTRYVSYYNIIFFFQYRSKQCPLCDFSDVQKQNMLSHFTNVHEINISVKELSFDNLHDFEDWRNNIKDAAFVTEFTKILDTCRLKVYKCNRSGLYIPKKIESERIRHLKLGGSNKINSFCPAIIKNALSTHSTGSVRG